jgi:histidinol-phosphate aminotransferase
MTGRPRPAVAAMPRYRPGKGAAQAEAEHGISQAIKLASNETPWGPLPAIVEAVRESLGGVNRYADHRATELRARLADWIGVDPGQVTVGAGSVTLLQQLFLSYVDAGDEVVYPWRSFEVYPVYSRLMQASDVQIPLVDHVADIEAIAEAVSPATKLVLIANPNNPTGTAVGVSRLRQLLDRVTRDTLVVVDEAYREFADPALGDPVAELVPQHDNLLVLRTFSKAQSLAGLRVGYAVGHPDVTAALDATCAPFAVNAPAQAAAIAAITVMDEIEARAERIRVERTRVLAAVREAGHEVPEPQANFLWIPTGAATDDVYLALERRGVVTRPFSGEGLRVTIGSPEENDRFLAALAEVAEGPVQTGES